MCLGLLSSFGFLPSVLLKGLSLYLVTVLYHEPSENISIILFFLILSKDKLIIRGWSFFFNISKLFIITAILLLLLIIFASKLKLQYVKQESPTWLKELPSYPFLKFSLFKLPVTHYYISSLYICLFWQMAIRLYLVITGCAFCAAFEWRFNGNIVSAQTKISS